MTHHDAEGVLKLARRGEPVPEHVITLALARTGDVEYCSFSEQPECDEFVRSLRDAGLLTPAARHVRFQ